MRKLSLKELNRVSPETFKNQAKSPFVLILDNVRSALNVGSAFRTADSFALEKIYLCGITAKPPHREILKTAIGATEAVDWEYFEGTTQVIKVLKNKGYTIVGVEQTDESIMLQDFEIGNDKKLALIFGNEVSGISDEVIPLLEKCIEVPQFGTKHSLNVSVCVGVVVWDLFKKWKF